MVDEAGQEQDRGLEDILHSGQRTKDNTVGQMTGGHPLLRSEEKDTRTENWRTSSTQVRGQRIIGQMTGGHPLLRSEDKG